MDLISIIFSLSLLVHIYFLVLSIINTITLNRIDLSEQERDHDESKLAILIPARNEERTIRDVLLSTLAQDYKDLHIFVMDDQSTDKTNEIIREIVDQNPGRITLLEGTDLPAGWMGKNWACWQLANKAKDYDYFLFIDSDVQLKPDIVSASLKHFKERKLTLLSALPQQITHTIGEAIIVPIMYWSMYSFYPMALVNTIKNKLFSLALGQFILMDKTKYFELGGHETVRMKVVEDVELAKLCKSKGEPIEVVNGENIVSTRMYHDLVSSIHGFSKNACIVLPGGVMTLVLQLVVVILLVVSPWAMVWFSSQFALIIYMQLIHQLIIASAQGLSVSTILLTPFRPFLYTFIGINSIAAYYHRGAYMWKTRMVTLQDQ